VPEGKGRFLLLGLQPLKAAKKKPPGWAASGAAYTGGTEIRQDDGFVRRKKYSFKIKRLSMRYYITP
jgi:hypothetical protein